MIIKETPIQYFIDRLRNKEYFSLAGYGDSAWICMLKESSRLGTRSGFGMLHTEETGDNLIQTLRWRGENYLRATPKLILDIFGQVRIDMFLLNNDVAPEFHERDMILDDLARDGGLFPLIEELKKHDIVMVGHPAYKDLDIFPSYEHIETGTPDFHLDYVGMNNVVDTIIRKQKPAVYLFAAGMSSALMISRLHGMPNSFFIDVGSILDAFVGIGGQRQWRAELYADEEKLKAWKKKNVSGE